MTNLIKDKHGRKIKKLRVSLLDTCNMRCFYCMPEDIVFKQNQNWLSPKEIKNICQNLVTFGIDEIRLTGGEPTLRNDFLTIASELSELNLSKLALTTNGSKLHYLLDDLKETKLSHLNISLDSLIPEVFARITRGKFELSNLLKNIEKAVEYGFKVKVNTVLLKGINDNEIDSFIKFSSRFNIEVRFLEVMKIGQMVNQYENYFISSDKVIDKITDEYNAIQLETEKDSTSLRYLLPHSNCKIGIIASETKAFCGNCSRLRMGPDGTIYPCLFVDQGIKLRGIDFNDYENTLIHILNQKPINRIEKVERPMYAIGG